MIPIPDRILDTTINLFLRGGIRKLSMDEIADNAGVSKVTIYKYFTDKDTLYTETGRRILSGIALKMERITASGDELVKKLFDFLECVSDFAGSGRFGLCQELARNHSGMEEEFRLYRKGYRRALLALIDDGFASGLIKSGVERDMAFHYIDMGVAYFQTCDEYRGRMLHDEDFRRKYMQFYVGSLFADAQGVLSAG